MQEHHVIVETGREYEDRIDKERKLQWEWAIKPILWWIGLTILAVIIVLVLKQNMIVGAIISLILLCLVIIIFSKKHKNTAKLVLSVPLSLLSILSLVAFIATFFMERYKGTTIFERIILLVLFVFLPAFFAYRIIKGRKKK